MLNTTNQNLSNYYNSYYFGLGSCYNTADGIGISWGSASGQGYYYSGYGSGYDSIIISCIMSGNDSGTGYGYGYANGAGIDEF